jgi:hypothetical protein
VGAALCLVARQGQARKGRVMKSKTMNLITILMILFTCSAVAGARQQTGSTQQEAAPAGTVPVSMVVSVEARNGKQVPVIYRQDVKVLRRNEHLQVKDWVPLEKDQAGLELFVLIDDSVDSNVGLQFDDLRKFMNEQPATTAIGVGYIRNGTVQVAQELTHDHTLAAKALRLPVGIAGGIASPYLALTDLIKRWPESPNRREIFMASSGIDALQPGPVDSYLRQAIEHAQRAGIQVYSIYASPAGHAGHTPWLFNWGQNNLSQLADETGAEVYMQALRQPISYGPYLDQFADRLKHQYRLTFYAKPGKEAGFQRIALETEVPNAELVSQDSVWVPAK